MYLTPVPKVKSITAVNDKLVSDCLDHDLRITDQQKQTIGELFEIEKETLLSLPARPYNNYKLISARVDKYQTVKINTNRYSVPHRYVKETVVIEVGIADVRVTYKNELISKHAREYEKDKWILDPWHYMPVLERKPGALKTSRVLTSIENKWHPVIIKLYEKQINKFGEYDGVKEFISTILYFKDKNYDDMICVVQLAFENKTLNKDAVVLLHDSLTENITNIEDANTSEIDPISNFTIPEADVNKFDKLIYGGA
jgi:hypothetical protein